MIVDTSALAAIFFGEPEAAHFIQLIHATDLCMMSAANFLELSIVVEGQIGPDASRQCDIFFRRAGIIIEPFTVEQAHLARQAFLDFGKGRHAAGLNFGDCFRMRSPRSPASLCFSRERTSQKPTSHPLSRARQGTTAALQAQVD